MKLGFTWVTTAIVGGSGKPYDELRAARRGLLPGGDDAPDRWMGLVALSGLLAGIGAVLLFLKAPGARRWQDG
jgi:hypothetical protein